MPNHPISPFDDLRCSHGVCVVDGYGTKVHVRHGHLVVEDGIGQHRRTRRFHKATGNLDRLVLIAQTGYVTLEALQWLDDAEVELLRLDADGRLSVSSVKGGRQNPKMRRNQARAAEEPLGVDIIRHLLHAKISGQAAVVSALTSDKSVHRRAAELSEAASLAGLAAIEAAAAATYWAAWSDLPIQFSRADLARVPVHWLTFGIRRSSISGRKRLATNPAQAMLNYLYSILEAEARIACATVGLDPAMGLLHSDQPYRDSLALDIMEAVRPEIDRYVLDLILGHRFSFRDFAQTKRGGCRLGRRLAHSLSETCPAWREAVGPTVEHVARMISGERPPEKMPLPTPLSQQNRRARWDGRGPGTTAEPMTPPTPKQRCAVCGSAVGDRSLRCGACDERFQESQMPTKQLVEEARQLSAGSDPSHADETARRVGATQTLRIRARVEWEQNNELPDKSTYFKEIQPFLDRLTVRAIVAAIGLSRPYCWKIREGDVIPHAMHWNALRNLVIANSAGT